IVSVMPKTLPKVSFVFGRGGRLGKWIEAMKTAEARKVTESRIKAAVAPKNPVTTPPTAAPKVSITDQVTEEMALAGSNSRSETIEGTDAVRAGSKKVEKVSCSTVSTKMIQT